MPNWWYQNQFLPKWCFSDSPQGCPTHWVRGHILPHTPRALAVLMWLLNSNTPLDTKFQHHWPADESFGFNLLFSCSDSVVAQGFASHPCRRERAYSRARQPVLNHAEGSPVLRRGPRLPLSMVALFGGSQHALSWSQSASLLTLPGSCSPTFGRVLLSWMYSKGSEPQLCTKVDF